MVIRISISLYQYLGKLQVHLYDTIILLDIFLLAIFLYHHFFPGVQQALGKQQGMEKVGVRV